MSDMCNSLAVFRVGASNKHKYLFLGTSSLHFRIWNYDEGQDFCYYEFMFVYLYLLCSRKDLRWHNVWISDLCVGAVPFDIFVQIHLLMIWLIHGVWFISIIIYISSGHVFKETLDVLLEMLRFSAWGIFIFHKQRKSEPWKCDW